MKIADRVCLLAAAICIFGILILNFFDALLRHVFSMPIQGTIEITSLTMIPVTYLGLSMVQHEGRHIRIMVLIERLSEHKRRVMEIIVNILGLSIMSAVVWFSSIQTANAFRTGDYLQGAVSVPTSPFHILVPIGSALLCVRFVMHLYRDIRKLSAKGGQNVA